MCDQSHNPLRILVMDDKAETVDGLVRLLESEGHSATGVSDCPAGRAAARAEQFDLLVTELGLPDHDGCELLADLRAIQPLRAFALTGHSTAAELARVRQAGFDEYFLKPFSVGELMAAVRRVATELAAKRGHEPPTPVQQQQQQQSQ